MFENIALDRQQIAISELFDSYTEMMGQISELEKKAEEIRAQLIHQLEESGVDVLKNSQGTLQKKEVKTSSIDAKEFVKAFGKDAQSCLKVELTKAKTLFGRELVEKGLIETKTSTRWEYRRS